MKNYSVGIMAGNMKVATLVYFKARKVVTFHTHITFDSA
jgi:hypothetical protein